MLLYVSVALIILLLTLILHCSQHFKIYCCRPAPKSPWDIPTRVQARSVSQFSQSGADSSRNNPGHSSRKSTGSVGSVSYVQSMKKKNRKRCRCSIRGVDEEVMNFYPIAFTAYILFTIFLCCVIVTVEFMNNYNNYHSHIHVSQLIYGFSMKSYHFNDINAIHNVNTNEHHHIPFLTALVDHILIYGVLILAIWESLFTFYRFYTTFHTATTLKTISTKTVVQKFIYYPIIFLIAFVLQVHLYYWFGPVVILLHCIFNYYFTLKFAAVLIHQYNMFNQLTQDMSGNVENANNDILNSVYFMRRISLICCVLQSIYLSLFIITYNVNTIYYLPILWSFQCTAFALNFIRNRKAINHLFIRIMLKFQPKVNTESSVTELNKNIQFHELNVKSCGTPDTYDTNANPYGNAVKGKAVNVTQIKGGNVTPLEKGGNVTPLETNGTTDIIYENEPIEEKKPTSAGNIQANPLYGTNLALEDNFYETDEKRNPSWRARHFSDVADVRTAVMENNNTNPRYTNEHSGHRGNVKGNKALKLLGIDAGSQHSNSHKRLWTKSRNSNSLHSKHSNSILRKFSNRSSNSKLSNRNSNTIGLETANKDSIPIPYQQPHLKKKKVSFNLDKINEPEHLTIKKSNTASRSRSKSDSKKNKSKGLHLKNQSLSNPILPNAIGVNSNSEKGRQMKDLIAQSKLALFGSNKSGGHSNKSDKNKQGKVLKATNSAPTAVDKDATLKIPTYNKRARPTYVDKYDTDNDTFVYSSDIEQSYADTENENENENENNNNNDADEIEIQYIDSDEEDEKDMVMDEIYQNEEIIDQMEMNEANMQAYENEQLDIEAQNNYSNHSTHSNYNEDDYDEAFRFLSSAATLGFCSKRDLNSFNQIKKYYEKQMGGSKHVRFESKYNHMGKAATVRAQTGYENGKPNLKRVRSKSDRNLTGRNNTTDVRKTRSVNVGKKGPKNKTSMFRKAMSTGTKKKNTSTAFRKAKSTGTSDKMNNNSFWNFPLFKHKN